LVGASSSRSVTVETADKIISVTVEGLRITTADFSIPENYLKLNPIIESSSNLNLITENCPNRNPITERSPNINLIVTFGTKK
jgi:hypothetical protein